MDNKIKVFNYQNLSEITGKPPIICFYSENGACGPSGLFYVIFDDGTLYAYSTFYEKSDKGLIKEIMRYVPELESLIQIPILCEERKRCRFDTVFGVYLGLGNHSLIREDILSDIHEKLDYPTFVKLCEKLVGTSLKPVFEMVNKEINKQ